MAAKMAVCSRNEPDRNVRLRVGQLAETRQRWRLKLWTAAADNATPRPETFLHLHHCSSGGRQESGVGNIIWTIVIGFVAGIIARMLAPGPNNPAGFILTTLLGIAGAFIATWIGQAIGWYRMDQGAGLIGATVGALVVLFIWHRLVVNRTIPDPGNRRWL